MKKTKKKVVAKKKVVKKPDLAKCVPLKGRLGFTGVPTEIVADDPMFVPQYKTEDAACVDLVANLKENGKVVIQHRGVVLVDCGFSMALPPGYKAEVVAHLSFASLGLIILSSLVENGRIKVALCNIGQVNPITIKHGQVFAGLILSPIYKFDWKQK